MSFARHFQGNGIKFFRDLGVLAGGQVISKVLGFLAFAWLARALDPASYGAVEYVVSLSVFFAIAVDGGLGIIGTRRVARNPDRIALLAFQISTARLILTALSIPLMVLVAYATSRDSAPSMLILLFAASLLTTPWRQQWMFQATGRMAAVANADVVRMAVFGSIVWLTVQSSDDILMVGWAEVVAVTAMTAYCLRVQTRHVVPVRLTGSLQGFGALMREGALVGSSNFIWALTQAVPLMLVSAILGGVATAWFAGAARITGSIVHFSNIYHFNLYPAVSKAHAADDETLEPLLRSSMRLTAWGGVFVGLVLTVFAAPLVRLTLGDKLSAAAPVLQILAWLVPVSLWSGHARWALAAAGAQRSVIWAQLAGLSTTVVVGIAAGRSLGATGFALGTVAGAFAVWIVSDRLALRHDCRPPSPRPTLVPLVLAGAIIACTTRLQFSPVQAMFATSSYLLLAPLLDRALFKDIKMLSQVRAHPERSVPELLPS